MNERATSLVVARPTWPSHITSPLTTLVREHRAQAELALAIIIYFGFACRLTWPLIIHMTHTLYAVGGDPYGTMATYRELVNHHVNPFLPGTLHQFAAPEGLPIPWPRNLASAPGVLTLYLLTFFFGSAPALSLYTLAGYILTGTVTFLFARRLTGNAWAALIAGWAFAFYPFAIINGLGHIDNVQGWLLVLAVWRLVELMWHPSRRNGLLAGLAVVLAMWWSPYFILFGGVIYATITIVALASSWRNGRLRAMIVPQLIVALLVLLFLIYLGVLSTAGSAEISVRNHNIGNLYTYAARPLEYLLPDVKNLLFGGDTAHYIETHQHASNPMENMLYLGITVMFLAFVAIISLFLRKLKARVGTVVLMLLLLAVVAIATSMQPEMSIFGTVIPFPSHFISQLTTTWRVYSRFVMVVMLAFSLLAAVGLDVLTRSRGPRAKIAIMCLATIAVPLDLWYQRPNSVVKLSTPGIYKTLARQTPGLVAEYPLSVGGGNLYNDVYYRDVYNMPIITGYLEHSIQELRALSLYNLAYPSTAGQLAALGVRYVIVDASPPDWGWPQSGKPGQGFHLIAHESYASLYEVTARPTGPALATIGPGLMLTNVTEAGTTAWLEQSKGTIALAGQCSHCEGVLSMVLASEAPHPKAIILDSHGHLLAQGSVSRYTLVKVPLNFSKHTSVTLEATREPGTNSKPEEGSGIDIRVTNLEFTPLNGEPDHGNATESGKHGKST